jgi:integrase
MNTDQPGRIPVGDRVCIYARGKKGIYVADFWDGTKHSRQSLKTSNKKEAVKRATGLAAQLDDGTFRRPATATATSVRQSIDDYIAHLSAEGRARKTTVKYTGILNAFAAFLAGHRVTKLSQFATRHFDLYRVERAKVRHRKTMYVEGVVLKQWAKWCKSRRLVAENPLAEVKLVKPIPAPRGGPSLEQVNLVLGAAAEPLRSQLAVLAFTGARSGELQRLRPEDIDLAGGWVHIVSRAGAETKTRMSRKVPIHSRLRAVLEALPATRRTYLFVAGPSDKFPAGGNHINTKRLNEQFGRLCDKLGLPTGRKDGFVIHSLRHFFETICVNAGIPQRAIDTWLGHRSDKSMAAVYYKLADVESKAFMDEVPFGTGLAGADSRAETRR